MPKKKKSSYHRISKTTTTRFKGAKSSTVKVKARPGYREPDLNHLLELDIIDLKELALELLKKALSRLDKSDKALFREILKLTPENKIDFTIGLTEIKEKQYKMLVSLL